MLELVKTIVKSEFLKLGRKILKNSLAMSGTRKIPKILLASYLTKMTAKDNKGMASLLNKYFYSLFTIDNSLCLPQAQNVFPGTENEKRYKNISSYEVLKDLEK